MKKIKDARRLDTYIKKHNLYTILDKDLIDRSQIFAYEKEEHILEAGTQLEYYYLLVEGKVKVSYLFENGKSMLLKFYKDFNTIGDLELYKDVAVLCNVDAVEDTYLLVIPCDFIRKNYFTDIKFLGHLVESLGDKLYATINNSSYNYIYPLMNRLSSYLLEYKTEKDFILLNSSYQEISQFLGTTYRHLNRTLNEMEAEGFIRSNGKRIEILNLTALTELAKNIYVKPL